MGKIIVTGGAGFIGSRLVEELVKQGREVIIIDNFSTGARDNLKTLQDSIDIIECDLSNYEESMKSVENLGDVDFIYHLAALPRIGRSVEFPLETHNANVTATLVALELARNLKVKKFFFASSSSIYGIQEVLPLTEDMRPNPQNPYAAQKLMGEIYCDDYSKVYDVKTIVFRLFNVYGPGMTSEGAYKLVFPIWMEQKKKGVPLTIYGGEQTRDFTHITDAVRGFILGMSYAQKDSYEVFNLGGGRQVSIDYLASLFKHETLHEPEKLHEDKFKQADISRAKTLLGWEPKVSIEMGVEELLR